LLNEEILKLLNLANQACSWAATILTNVRHELVQLNSLGTGQAVKLNILFAQEVILGCQAPSFLVKLVDLRRQKLCCLLLGIILKLGEDLRDRHIGLDHSLLGQGEQLCVGLSLLVQLVLELYNRFAILLVLINQLSPLLITRTLSSLKLPVGHLQRE